MFDAGQFCEYVIEPALKHVGLYSKSAEQLLLGTACAESKLGTYLHQIKGPAMGVFQVEPLTHEDIWYNYINYRPELKRTIHRMVPDAMWDATYERPCHHMLIGDLKYAAVMARLVYRRSPMALPVEGQWGSAAQMWKSVYNTHLGAGTELHFMDSLACCKVI